MIFRYSERLRRLTVAKYLRLSHIVTVATQRRRRELPKFFSKYDTLPTLSGEVLQTSYTTVSCIRIFLLKPQLISLGPGVTQEQKKQILGHNENRTFERYYQSRHVALDVAQIYRGDDARPEKEAVLSMRLERDLSNLPPRPRYDCTRAKLVAALYPEVPDANVTPLECLETMLTFITPKIIQAPTLKKKPPPVVKPVKAPAITKTTSSGIKSGKARATKKTTSSVVKSVKVRATKKTTSSVVKLVKAPAAKKENPSCC